MAALVGLDDWRLTAPIDPRRVERIGLTLNLSHIEAGDSVDWVRMVGCRVAASFWEPGFPPALALSGRLWPHPLGPSAWISRFDADDRDPSWFEVTFNRPRPVERIELVWASAAGWSEQFDPGRVRLELLRDTIPKLLASEEITPATGPVHEWTARETAEVARVRLTFIEPSRMALDQRARLMALRVWGPWDGESPAP